MNSTCITIFEFDSDNLLFCGLLTIAIQTSFFIISYCKQFDKVIDFAGSLNFFVVAIVTFFLAHTYAVRQILITLFVSFWAIRLGSYLLIRVLKVGKDDRFDGRRENFLQFAIFWIFQAVWVVVVSLPLIFINSCTYNEQDSDEAFGKPQDIIGILLFVFGIIIEAVADIEKFNYRSNQANKDHWCDAGLWAFSRHPNYYGEILLWIGIYVFSTSVLTDWRIFVAVLSPVFITTILLFLSGIPLLEKSADMKFGHLEEYQKYKARTSPLILMPSFCYGCLPQLFKCVFFCECPCYSQKLQVNPEDGVDEKPATVSNQPNEKTGLTSGNNSRPTSPQV